MSLKTLKVTAVFRVPYAMTLAVVTLDVLGETFSFHPTLYMYICVQIIQVKNKNTENR